MKPPLIIDGSFGEGGGSIVRFSVAFGSLLKKRIKIENIRANRKKSGLRLQHLVGINLINQISKGNLIGSNLGSTNIEYIPNNQQNEFHDSLNIQTRVDTAASIGLIFQATQLACIGYNNNIHIEINGGATFGKWAPSITYIKEVTLKYLKILGYSFNINVIQDGFFPKGDSKVIITYEPLKNVTNNIPDYSFIDRKPIDRIYGQSIASTHLRNKNVAERQTEAVISTLDKIYPEIETEIKTVYTDTSSPGSAVTLWTSSDTPFGNCVIGEKGISSEKVGKKAAEDLLNDWNKGGVIDYHMTDQIIPYFALKENLRIKTQYPISPHTKTNMWIVRKITNTKIGLVLIDNDSVIIESS